MDNVLEGMKGLYTSKGGRGSVITITGFDVNANGDIWYRGLDYPNLRISSEFITPLLKFPDKDSEGNDCWSGDIFTDGDKEIVTLLVHDGFQWMYFDIFNVKGKVWIEKEMHLNYATARKLFMLNHNRMCHSFDSNASELTNLDQDTIDKLKEIV